MDLPSQEIANGIAKILSAIMRIQDWDISVHIVSGYEMAKHFDGDSEYNGLSDRNVRLNKAEIFINKENPGGWYETLVHELLHVQSTSLVHTANAYFNERHSYFNDIYESFTEKQAQMFCKLYPLKKLKSEHPDVFK